MTQTNIRFWTDIRNEKTPRGMADKMRVTFMRDLIGPLFIDRKCKAQAVGEVTIAMADLAKRVERCGDRARAIDVIEFFRSVRQL